LSAADDHRGGRTSRVLPPADCPGCGRPPCSPGATPGCRRQPPPGRHGIRRRGPPKRAYGPPPLTLKNISLPG
jgi:hypothetical protein